MMRISLTFLNCGRDSKLDDVKLKWSAIASTLHSAIGKDPHVVGLCEVFDDGKVPKIVKELREKTGKKYHQLVSKVVPGAPRLALLVDASLGHLQHLGDDESYRHGKDWRHWLAGRVDLFKPGTTTPSLQQLVVVVNHWTSMKSGRQDTMVHREILAWEVGNWMCSKDLKSKQVLADGKGGAIPVYLQQCVVMGDFNCEPGSPELRSKRKFTLQAMRNEPSLWKPANLEKDINALLYDLSWRRLLTSPAVALPGTYKWPDLHSPAMLDRMLVSRDLWNGPDMRVALDVNQQAIRIIPAVNKCSDHSAIAITVETK
jgi:endonuclease/exonuclease/phosphatase family metal-dependent hydrolase